MRGESGGRGDKFGTITDPDVARSLKVLDLVIGEFDDGLESEIEAGKETQIKRNVKNKQNAAISDKIDHIFNELTQEIYVEQKRERQRQKSPTRNVFDPLPAPPQGKAAGRDRDHSEGVRGRAGQAEGKDGVKGRGKLRQEQDRQGRQHHDRRRKDSFEDDRPPPGVVQAAKQSYLHKTKESRAEVVLYNEGQGEGGKISEKVKADVHNHGGGSESSGGVKRSKSPGVRPSPASQVPAVATKEKAVIKELREKVDGKEGKISKFSQRGGSTSSIGKEEKRKDPVGSDSSASQGKPGKPKRATSTSEAVRLESVAEEGRGQNRMRERRPEQRRGREERGQRSRSVGALEQERAREEKEGEERRRLRRSRSRGSRDQLDQWEEVGEQRRSRSRSKSVSRSRGEILDVTASSSSKRQEATVRPVDGPRGNGGQMSGQPFSRRQFLAQAANLQNLPSHPPPPAHHTGFLSPMRGGLPPRRHGSLLDLRAGDDVRRTRHSYAAPIWEEYPPHLRGFPVDPRRGPLPPALDQQLRFEHQMNLEAHRDLLLRRGFPPSHPLVAGEIPIHPELMGHLHFEVPGNRTTLPLGQEDFARFLPEMQRRGMQSAFPVSTSDLLNFSEARAGKRKGGPKKEGVVRREGRGKERSRSSDPRAPRPHSMFSPSSHRWVEGQHDDMVDLREKAKTKEEKPWFMKDIGDLQSLPHFTTRNDSGIGDDLGQRPKLNREGQARSSFGMILKDKFQKNPNMYFPDTKSKSPDSLVKEKKVEEWSDTDTLVHNMSEGSFDKDSGLSGGHSIVSSGSNVSGESKSGSPSQHHSITTPKRPNNTAIALSSNPSVILNKKTLRNYTPRESGNMLRQFEETRQVTPGLEKVFNEEMPEQQQKGGYKTSTATSRISDWSMVSSAASFDYHPGRQEEDRAKVQDTWRAASLPKVEEVEPRGERIPPEGATAPKAPKGVTSPSAKSTDGKDKEDKVPLMKNGDKSANGVVKDLMEASENDDELIMLRKLLSEGRIAGLNEKPPSFKPPSPPSKPTKPHPKKNKAPSPKPQEGRNRAEKSPARGDKREAPKPPMDDELKPPPPSEEVQFLSGRRIQSVENLHSGEGEVDGGRRRDGCVEAVRRSTSMHTQKEYENKAAKSGNDDALAQLIADSTERKFKLNSIFKGIWKKKQYSFDLG